MEEAIGLICDCCCGIDVESTREDTNVASSSGCKEVDELKTMTHEVVATDSLNDTVVGDTFNDNSVDNTKVQKLDLVEGQLRGDDERAWLGLGLKSLGLVKLSYDQFLIARETKRALLKEARETLKLGIYIGAEVVGNEEEIVKDIARLFRGKGLGAIASRDAGVVEE
ncbi:hypothetical protein V6N13_006200 [Hibiscus sabdariffa]